MKKNLFLYIVPHTHWDREWYMSFEQHRVKLVEFMDRLIDTMESNPRYTVFHLDGQYIPIEDYLEIRPQMRERLTKLIRDNRIQIGPWYVLQDEFFTSGEANVRNMLYGLKLCRELGAKPVMCGYFPDSFANISQAPQILRGFGIDNAAFGRGLNEVRYNNEIVPGDKASISEVRWMSPDGSEVLGVVFAHWYNNAQELPSDETALKARLEEVLAAAQESAATPYLLGMNGCDHTPVQVNLPDVLETARNLFPQVEFRQSGFSEYVDQLRPYQEKFPLVCGEIRGQHTSGGCQLVSTGSSHIPLKQQNHHCQNALEKMAEPLNVLSFLAGDEYRSDFLFYSWKTLMKNHPHDSICSCSVDEVTQEMKIRFDKSRQVADCVSHEALDYLGQKIQTPYDKNIVVFHTSPLKTTETVTTTVDFQEGSSVAGLTVYDADGKVVPAAVRHLGRTFDYRLPKDTFRERFFVNRFEVTMTVTMEGIGWQTFRVETQKMPVESSLKLHENGAENEFISFSVGQNGEITLTDKRTGLVYEHLNAYDTTGDKGDLYNFIPVENGMVYTTKEDIARVWLVEKNAAYITWGIENHLYVPDGLTPQKTRTETGHTMTITAYVTLREGMDRLEFRTVFDNRAENHRLRALFSPAISTDVSLACTPFDITERPLHPWDGWKSPTYSHRMQEFFALEGEERALLIAGKGLHEYEVERRDGTMTLTILRSIGEIGDWGDFPTPDGFCKRTMSVEYAVVPYVKQSRFTAYQSGFNFSNTCVTARDLPKQRGVLPETYCLLSVPGNKLAFSALKKCEDDDGLLLRLYNLDEATVTVEAMTHEPIQQIMLTDLAEQELSEVSVSGREAVLSIDSKKIVSLKLKH